MVSYDDILHPLKEHLRFLLENDIQELVISHTDRSETHKEEQTLPKTKGKGGPSLEDIRCELGDCKRCPLGAIRENIVFGEGDPNAEILFVGEGPGEEEDRTGRPFVGRAGQLLTKIIESGMQIKRSSVYICNIIKCRPPGNRAPGEEEIEVCVPFLKKQIQAIRPKVIITLGRPATCTLLGVQEPMHRLRGKWHSYNEIPLMPTYHPAFLLRQYTAENRRLVWEDTLEALKLLEISDD